MGSRWYVARTEPRAEFLAAKELDRDGFEIFFPRTKALQPLNTNKDEPLFPGYLFLRCDPENEGWPSFRPGHRILGWVRFGGEMPWIPDEDVTELKKRIELINLDGGPWRRFHPGELVRIISHSLEGLAEIVEEPKSRHARAKVLLQFMGRLVQAQIPWQNLSPVPDSERENHRAPRRTRGRGRWIPNFGPRAVAGT